MENDVETGSINKDILAGEWTQIRGELKTWWGKLTDDDVYKIGGQKDKLTGLCKKDTDILARRLSKRLTVDYKSTATR